MEKVILMMKDEGYKINNLDTTIIAERPKMAPYIDNMKEKDSAIVG